MGCHGIHLNVEWFCLADSRHSVWLWSRKPTPSVVSTADRHDEESHENSHPTLPGPLCGNPTSEVTHPDPKVHGIDLDLTSIRHVRVGSMSNRDLSDGLWFPDRRLIHTGGPKCKAYNVLSSSLCFWPTAWVNDKLAVVSMGVWAVVSAALRWWPLWDQLLCESGL